MSKNHALSEEQGFTIAQAERAQKMFAAVALAALDDAIADDRKYGNGVESIMRWARSRDGREILSLAGIEPSERVVQGMADFVSRGVHTNTALARDRAQGH